MSSPATEPQRSASAKTRYGQADAESGRAVVWVAAIVLFLSVLAFSLYVLREKKDDESDSMITEQVGAGESSESIPTEEPLPEPRLDLPVLDESDVFIRDQISALSDHPILGRLIENEELIRRFTAAVDEIAQGKTPRKHLPFLEPEEDFAVLEKEDAPYLDPASFNRYDFVFRAFDSLDSTMCAALYEDLKPLFTQAYRDLGYPDQDFDVALFMAMDQILSAPIIDGPVELVEEVLRYEFADPELEGMNAVHKHLVRMGPDNTRRIHAKIQTIRAAMEQRRARLQFP